MKWKKSQQTYIEILSSTAYFYNMQRITKSQKKNSFMNDKCQQSSNITP